MSDVLLLHGVADRDATELVAMFFDSREDLEEFRASLPGRYQVMGVNGVDYDALSVAVDVDSDDDDDCWNDLEVFVPDDDDYEFTVKCDVCTEYDMRVSEAIYLAQAATARADNFDYEGYVEANDHLSKVQTDWREHRGSPECKGVS